MAVWQPLSWTFPHPDWKEYVKATWPNVYVDAMALRNQPTKDDPLGAKGPMVFEHNSDDHTVRIAVLGESSPWLKPDAVEAYLYIHWPEYFRRGENGQAPD